MKGHSFGFGEQLTTFDKWNGREALSGEVVHSGSTAHTFCLVSKYLKGKKRPTTLTYHSWWLLLNQVSQPLAYREDRQLHGNGEHVLQIQTVHTNGWLDSHLSGTSKALKPGEVTLTYVTTVFVWIDWLEQCFDTPSLTILQCIRWTSIGQAMVQKDITILLLLSTAGSGGVLGLSILSWKKKERRLAWILIGPS